MSTRWVTQTVVNKPAVAGVLTGSHTFEWTNLIDTDVDGDELALIFEQGILDQVVVQFKPLVGKALSGTVVAYIDRYAGDGIATYNNSYTEREKVVFEVGREAMIVWHPGHESREFQLLTTDYEYSKLHIISSALTKYDASTYAGTDNIVSLHLTSWWRLRGHNM
jgi:hypothetical protein